MQKKLIAVAIAAALATPAAFAQSNVTISGLIKAGVERFKNQDTNSENRVSDQSSRLIISGNEDLGGGLKAWFQIDNRFATDIGGASTANGSTGLATGNTGVGLSSDSLGKITIGRWDLHFNAFSAIDSDRAGSLQSSATSGIMSQVGDKAIAITSRSSNVFMYDSPSINGFTAKVAYSSNPAGNEGQNSTTTEQSKGTALNVALNYANGPLVAGYSYWKYDIERIAPVTDANALDQRSDRIYIGYTEPLGVKGLKLGLGYDRSKVANYVGTNEAKRSAWLLPISYEFSGAHALRLTYARASNGSLGGSNVADSGATFWKFGYDYAFSKRTSAGVYYTKLNNRDQGKYTLFSTGGTVNAGNGAALPGTGKDASQLYLGVAHSF